MERLRDVHSTHRTLVAWTRAAHRSREAKQIENTRATAQGLHAMLATQQSQYEADNEQCRFEVVQWALRRMVSIRVRNEEDVAANSARASLAMWRAKTRQAVLWRRTLSRAVARWSHARSLSLANSWQHWVRITAVACMQHVAHLSAEKRVMHAERARQATENALWGRAKEVEDLKAEMERLTAQSDRDALRLRKLARSVKDANVRVEDSEDKIKRAKKRHIKFAALSVCAMLTRWQNVEIMRAWDRWKTFACTCAAFDHRQQAEQLCKSERQCERS